MANKKEDDSSFVQYQPLCPDDMFLRRVWFFMKTSKSFRTAFFGVGYIVMATFQSFYNKYVFTEGFVFPITLCFSQSLGVLLLFGLFYLLRQASTLFRCRIPLPPPVNTDHFIDKIRVLSLVSFCGFMNLVLNTWSLIALDISIYIVVRSCTIVWVVLFGYLMLNARISFLKLMSCVLVMGGGILVSFSFIHGHPTAAKHSASEKATGLIFCLLSTVANGVLLVAMKKVLQKPSESKGKGSKNLSMQGFDFIFYQTLCSSGLLGTVLWPLEGQGLQESEQDMRYILWLLVAGSLISLLYQLVLTGLVDSTTPLTKEIIAQSKIIPQTSLAIVVFNEHYNQVTVMGLLATAIGSFLYSYLNLSEDAPKVHSAIDSSPTSKEDLDV
eukprot:GILK01003433.1.p1 GENE.GILK01003433.1~~GILK01003433.1.p1  ORF type:complete len:384 (+),score=61.74 GILK01003433.1:83-1234(+)